MSDISELNKLIQIMGPENVSKETLDLLVVNMYNSTSYKKKENDRLQEIDSIIESEEVVSKKVGKTTRPLESEEYNTIISLLRNGFKYQEGNKTRIFRPQPNVAFALALQASLGLRISDVMQLKVRHFQKDKLELSEKKTNKLQYRSINKEVSEYVRDYAWTNELSLNDKIISCKIRWIQDRLKIVSDHMDLENISTHSFRKYFATSVYEKSGGDIELVKSLLNHSSVAVTQKYLKTSQKKIDEISASMNFIDALKDK